MAGQSLTQVDGASLGPLNEQCGQRRSVNGLVQVLHGLSLSKGPHCSQRRGTTHTHTQSHTEESNNTHSSPTQRLHQTVVTAEEEELKAFRFVNVFAPTSLLLSGIQLRGGIDAMTGVQSTGTFFPPQLKHHSQHTNNSWALSSLQTWRSVDHMIWNTELTTLMLVPPREGIQLVSVFLMLPSASPV